MFYFWFILILIFNRFNVICRNHYKNTMTFPFSLPEHNWGGRVNYHLKHNSIPSQSTNLSTDHPALFQVFANIPGKSTYDGLSPWPLPPTWKMLMEFLGFWPLPGTRYNHLMNESIDKDFFFLSLSHSTFQIHKIN